MTVINLDVKQQPDPNDRDGHGRTRLHNLFLGLFECESSELQQALKAGCDVNAADNWGDTPLHTLIGSIMNDAARADLIHALLKAGANVNAAGSSGNTPLHLAVDRKHMESVKVLLQAGANINTPDKYGDTPLRKAVNGRNTEVVKLLLEHGADITIKNRFGDSLLQEAISDENFACAEILQQHAAEADGTNRQDSRFAQRQLPVGLRPGKDAMSDESVAAGSLTSGITMESAASAQDIEMEPGAEVGADHEPEPENAQEHGTEPSDWSNPNARDGKGRTRLHKLCRSYNATADNLRRALDAGADVNAADNWGSTPLHALISGGFNNKTELINILIEAGAKVDAVDCINRTALFHAVAGENTGDIQTLLQAGANVNARDEYGDTPLREAIRKRDTSLLKLLLEHGAAVNARDKYFETPLRLAERSNNFACVQILREHGAYAGIAGQIAITLRRIIGKPAAINPAKS